MWDLDWEDADVGGFDDVDAFSGLPTEALLLPDTFPTQSSAGASQNGVQPSEHRL